MLHELALAMLPMLVIAAGIICNRTSGDVDAG
jgi:hypothetical protein